MSEYVLRTSGVTKKYGGAFALDKVDIEIQRGQIYGLIGLNGAGKTTFMRAVTGLISLTGGAIELFGESGGDALRRARRRIGQSIETPALYQNMTARQNLEVQQILGGLTGKSNIDEILNVVELEDTGKKKAKNFSLGMKQRLALGMTLITNPEFLILDEPTNGLDPKGIIEMRRLMLRLAHERGLTLLVSSHLLDELAQVATNYGIIDKGRMIKQISAEELALESRRYIKLLTDDVPAAASMLSEKFHMKDFLVVEQSEIRIFEQLDKISEINAELVHTGVRVKGIVAEGQKLEEYFTNLTGGATS